MFKLFFRTVRPLRLPASLLFVFPTGLLFLFLLSGCSKSHSPQSGLIGQWKLDYAESVTPGTVLEYVEGIVLDLHADSTYKEAIPRGVSLSGTFGAAVSINDTVSHSYLYLKAAGADTASRFAMQLAELRLTLKGQYAIEYYHKQ
jgi:hypothetical protein